MTRGPSALLAVVRVRPDWTGPEYLFGYPDALRSAPGKEVWAVPDALDFVLRAAAEPAEPYLLVLDEMNLAHVERYFADFLSGVESRLPVLPVLAHADGEWVAVEGANPVPVTTQPGRRGYGQRRRDDVPVLSEGSRPGLHI